MRALPVFFLLFISITLLSATTSTTHNRRILHQPFFPDDSFPPPQPPFPAPLADSPPDSHPFFPSIPSPPPPPSAPASFPANISSLSSAKSKPVSSKLIVTAFVVVIAAVLVVALVVGLRVRKRKQMREGFSDGKTYRSDNSGRLFGSSTNNNGNGGAGGGGGHSNGIPRLQRPSQTSSEFLYLGTLVNSHGGGIDARPAMNSGGDVSLRKLDSPELHPLPPLGGGGHSVKHGYEMADLESSREDEFEEFYSPRVSIGGRDSSIGTGSGRTFAAAAAENFESRRIIGSGSGSSSSYSSSSSGSGSNSPARRSVSLSISPPVSLSPIRPRPKSPELVAIVQTSAPSRPAPPPPPSPIFSKDLGKSQETSARISNFSEQNSTPLANIRSFSSATLSVPPPPPPPPPPSGHWKTPSPKTPAVRAPPLLKPPVLITPSRPVSMLNPSVISPMKLPTVEKNEETPKPRLKPLHWDKVRASSDREMVWDQLKSSSFKLNEEMIETLFVVKTPTSNPKETTNYGRPILPSPNQENSVLDPKKSQNIAISLRALNVTIEEVCEALLEGNADALGTELLESLLKMAPTKEEEHKLKEYRDDSPFKLGPAEKFLKALLDIPFAFKRVDAMLYVSNFDSEIEYLKRSFETLEAACEELRNNRMFLKLLEAVLKTGNRMNVGTKRGDAHAFKLDTLLKLVDVKGADGKTTLLHFVVQEIIKSEGARLSNNNQTPSDDAKCRKLGLQIVSGLCSDLANVKKAAAMDSEVLNGDVLKLSKGISNILEVVRLSEMTGMEENKRKFSSSMKKFMKIAEEEIIRIQAQGSVALSLVKEITEYFHGNSAREEAHPFRIFMVVRDFLTVLDRVCKEVGIVNERKTVSSAHKFPVPVNPTLPPVFTGFSGRQQYSSSGDDSTSP